MKVAFQHSVKDLDTEVGEAFVQGVQACGDTARMVRKADALDADVLVMVGVKSRKSWARARAAGLRTIMVDRGYIRSPHYKRIAVDSHEPSWWLENSQMDRARADAIGWELSPWKPLDNRVLIAGSSQKYHDWYGLPNPTEYYAEVVKNLRHMGMDVIYRPKPAWRDKERIAGATFDRGEQGIYEMLEQATLLVTHGSAACFDALLHGMPQIVLGNGVTASISSRSLNEARCPRRASDEERQQLASNLAYCQWSLKEFASGKAWRHIRRMLEEQPRDYVHADSTLPH